MSSLTILGDTSGSVALTAATVAGSTAITIAAQSGTLNVGGPTFSAYSSSNATVSSAADTKITLDTELFDTNNNFSASRFTPTVAGYYQISATCKVSCSGNMRRNDIELFKNGSLYQAGSSIDLGASSTGVSFIWSTVSTVMYFNGSTDYVELYIFPQANSGTLTALGGSDKTWMSGCFLRGA